MSQIFELLQVPTPQRMTMKRINEFLCKFENRKLISPEIIAHNFDFITRGVVCSVVRNVVVTAVVMFENVCCKV